MEIRAIEAGDGPALVRFFERIPESDRTFLKEDVGDTHVVEHWVAPGAGRRIAIDDGEVVGSENPQVLTSGTEEQNLGFTSCNSPEGFKEGNFSSVIELFG